jgi:hypothetical protein
LELLAEKSPEIDKDLLKQSVEQNLASGKFQLIIAVDTINPELEKIIAYVSSRGTGLQLEALELELYRQGQVEILVPQRYGQLNQPQESPPGKQRLLRIARMTTADRFSAFSESCGKQRAIPLSQGQSALLFKLKSEASRNQFSGLILIVCRML